ncbi:MAG: M23 family metallopeptidase [Verrucomicrobiales bacterium]|nr:M23 family metallopeptidase [Verrucomicrobiales bacterium]
MNRFFRSAFFALWGGVFLATAPLASAGDESLKIWHQKVDGGYRVYARAADDFPRSVQVNLTSLKNLRSTGPTPFQTVVRNGTEPVFLFDLQIVKPGRGNRFNFEYEFVSGDFTSARHDDSHVYLLPFEHGTSHLLSQGYHGAFSHSDPGREYAVDFTMPEKTPVLAARGGTVVKVKTDSRRGGPGKSFEDQGNFITILHEDGSIAEYVHLIRGGSFVQAGQKVSAGERIALSGNTGRSTGPHLHFHVGIPTATGNLQTLPTRFLNHRNEAVSPREGDTYFASHPGKPPFNIPTGSETMEAPLQTNETGVPLENAISTRAETNNGTVTLFLRNGFSEAKEVLLTLPTMENLTPSKTIPLTMKLEPQSEQFAVTLKQRDSKKPFRYQTEWQYRSAR